MDAQLVRVSQGGLISKIEVDIVVAADVPENGLAFDRIDKINSQVLTGQLAAAKGTMLSFAIFESDSGFEEINERLSKFNQFHEITAIEDNFPFRFCDSKLFQKLIERSEVVFQPYSQQVNSTLMALQEAMQDDESNVFQTGDLLTSDHSSLKLTKTLVTGLISQREVNKCSVYIDIMSKFLRACFNFYSDQIDAIFVPLDFLIAQAVRLTTEKVKKLVFKTIHLLKQVIYEVSMQ